MSRTPAPFISVSFARLEAAATDLLKEKHEPEPYHLAYQEFIRYFADLETITPHNLIIGAHFTYGWMPTILTLHDHDNYARTARLLTDLKCGAPLSVETLEHLIGVINNSLVGTSKLLHFLSPERFAIWDSRVCIFIYGKEFSDSWARQCERYLFYLENCHELAADPAFPALHAKICADKIGQDVPPLRAIEWIMYSDSHA